jgi:NAD(P)-dependent dehydrogenase (short-subunit alcohol dehydrogenase family)
MTALRGPPSAPQRRVRMEGNVMNLKGKVVAVTGAGRGIGREIALLCAREGAAVVVNDPGVAQAGEGANAGPAEQTVADIRAAGGSAHVNTASVSDPDGAASIIADAVTRFGRIDAVVNNAGILRNALFEHMTLEEFEAVIDVHLKGAFLVSKAALPHFVAQKSGSYIHFTSAVGLVGGHTQANYAAAKAGIVGLSRTMALELAGYGIRSNCVAPWAFTRMLDSMTKDLPPGLPGMADPKSWGAEKIAPLVGFLASDAASDVTNQVFGVRKNEIYLFSRPQIIQRIANAEGWTVDSIAEAVMPAMRPDMPNPTFHSGTLTPYEPI